MLLALLFASTLAIGVLSLKPSGIDVQTDKRAESDWIKSLIFDNTKGTITLDSSALKLLMELSSNSSNTLRQVSFSVALRSKELRLGAGQTVKYDAVLTNDGNGYDDRTGVFTCPVAGTYMFVVDSLSFPGIWLHVKVNKKTVGSLHVSSGHNGNSTSQISRTVIVKLKSGDHVKIENGVKNGYIHPYLYSGFTGVLIYTD